MLILLYHFLIKDKDVDENIFRRNFEGAPCLYFRKESDFRRDMEFVKGKDNYWITFDDAHKSVYEIAFPILRKMGLKFSIFTPTKLVGDKSYCSWKQLKEMSAAGGSIESHGYNHLPFDSLTEEEVEYELIASRDRIRREIGRYPEFVSCPASRRISKEVVNKCGYKDIRYNLGEVKVMKNL